MAPIQRKCNSVQVTHVEMVCNEANIFVTFDFLMDALFDNANDVVKRLDDECGSTASALWLSC